MKIGKMLLILGIIVMVAATLTEAQEAARSATITELKGKVEVKIAQGAWMPAKVGMLLNQGDAVRTRRNATALLDLDGQARTARVEMKENSQLVLAELLENKTEQTQKTLLDLSLGKVLIKVTKLRSEQSKFEVKTPTSIVGVRGTTFSVAVEAVQ